MVESSIGNIYGEEIVETLRIGQFNARGPNNGIEHWFDLIREELIKRGHSVEIFWLRGKLPTVEYAKKNLDFNLYHFSQVALLLRNMGIPFCVLPSANDCLPDKGFKLRIAAENEDCKFVTYQSMFHLNQYNEWDIPKPKVYVPMPARAKLFKREQPFGEKIIAGGRLVPKKGLHQLFDVDNLVIFGDGPLKEKLQSQLPNAKFIGMQDGNGLKQLMEESWLLLCPYIITNDGDSEGLPNIIKEALLMELQVVASPVGAVGEFENISLLNDWNKINEIVKSIPKELNTKGKSEILKIFTPKICVDKLLDAIKENI